MNKIKFASIAMLMCFAFSQAAYATDEDALVKDLDQQLIEELSKEDVLSSSQDYVLEQTVKPQSRRSSLFAHILDTLTQNAGRV